MIYPSLMRGSAPADAVRDLFHDDEGDRLRGHRELPELIAVCLRRLERRVKLVWGAMACGAVSEKYDF